MYIYIYIDVTSFRNASYIEALGAPKAKWTIDFIYFVYKHYNLRRKQNAFPYIEFNIFSRI